MESLIHADIFFFITTVIVILLGIVLVVIFIYIALILVDIRAISRIARSESADIADDIHMIRSEVQSELRRGSSVIASLVRVIRGLFRRRKSRVNKG